MENITVVNKFNNEVTAYYATDAEFLNKVPVLYYTINKNSEKTFTIWKAGLSKMFLQNKEMRLSEK